MPQNEYVLHAKSKNRDNLNNEVYFSHCEEQEKKRPGVFVERSLSGIYDLPNKSDSEESEYMILDKIPTESNKCRCHTNKKILFFGTVIITVIVVCSILLGTKYTSPSSSKDQSFSYHCTPGFCGPIYGVVIRGTSNNVAKACSIDHPRCKAYQYSTIGGYGYLCSNETRTGSVSDFQNCVKYEGCGTIRSDPVPSPDPMKKCIFPFIFDEEEFNGCTKSRYNGVYWCPTQVLADGSLNQNSSKWGVCGSNCPKDDKKYNDKSTLDSGQFLMNSNKLASENRHFHLWMQKDGNLELHKYNRGDWIVIWASRTTGSGSSPYKLYLNERTNELEIHDKHNKVIWKSGVSVSNRNNFMPGGQAILERDGNFVVYDGKSTIMWSTGTENGNKSPAFGTGIRYQGFGIPASNLRATSKRTTLFRSTSPSFLSGTSTTVSTSRATPKHSSSFKFTSPTSLLDDYSLNMEDYDLHLEFKKIKKRYCPVRLEDESGENISYATLLQAKTACSFDQYCKGVYVSDCNQKNPRSKREFELCDIESAYRKSSTSCIYEKS